MTLASFPRPPRDNGWGMHLGFDLSPRALETYIPRLVELHATWCLIPHRTEEELARTAALIAAYGIMPISRWLCTVDEDVVNFARLVRVLESLNLPAYIQIFNEPSSPLEWRDRIPKPRAFVSRWCDHAARVAEAGGFPGLQVLDTHELEAVLRELQARSDTRVLERMWFCPHPYGLNHPPAYPYDPVNQRDHPGATLADDPATILQFLEFSPVFELEIGFVPPFIAGECGWQFGNAADPRYPPIDDLVHARYHAELVEWFRSGMLPNDIHLPDYLFAVCPWILYGREADAWYSSTTGTRRRTIEAIRAIPPFTRASRPIAFAPPQPARTPEQTPLIRHYLLLGAHDPAQWNRLILARQYITRFGVSFGFSVEEALRAERVTIMGDARQVSLEDEVRLKRAGVRTERWWGDLTALEIILTDRLNRDSEFGA